MAAITILHQDQLLVVCIKPAGIDTEHELPELIRAQTGVPSIYCIHRLDRDVGGLVVLALDGKTAAAMSEQFSRREVKKEYVAVLPACPEEKQADLDDLLYHDARKNKTFVVKRMRHGVKPASLHYQVMETAPDGITLVGIILGTGRSHQIRVQFASRMLPLLGDQRYGSRQKGCGIALWSWQLTFTHPRTHQQMQFHALPPEEWPWSSFLSLREMTYPAEEKEKP